MRTKRRVVGIVATMMAASAIMAGATAVIANTHPSTSNHVLTQDTSLASATTSDAAPDFYHDI